MPIEEVSKLSPPIGEGVEVISHTRVGDLRGLQFESAPAPEQRSWLFVYRWMRIRKLDPMANRFSIHIRVPTTQLEVRATIGRVPAAAQLYRGSTENSALS